MFLETTFHGWTDLADHVPGIESTIGGMRESLDKSAVAGLSESTINQMTCDELVRVIRAAELTVALHSDFEERLRYYDYSTLRRMAYLARHCCRNQGY